MDLAWSVFALTVATLTLALGARRILNVVSQHAFSRLIAVRGLIAFSVTRTDIAAIPEYRVRFEVGGPAVFDNVSVHLVGLPAPTGGDGLPTLPELRPAMRVGDDPIEWTFALPDVAAASTAWILVTWVRSHFDGTDAEAIAQRLDRNQLYEWRWYTEPTRLVRTGIRNLARRYPHQSTQNLRDMALYGRWRRTTSGSRADLRGPADRPPPAK